jgi:hypothetical protein
VTSPSSYTGLGTFIIIIIVVVVVVVVVGFSYIQKIIGWFGWFSLLNGWVRLG